MPIDPRELAKLNKLLNTTPELSIQNVVKAAESIIKTMMSQAVDDISEHRSKSTEVRILAAIDILKHTVKQIRQSRL
jgi:hypothetical protein